MLKQTEGGLRMMYERMVLFEMYLKLFGNVG